MRRIVMGALAVGMGLFGGSVGCASAAPDGVEDEEALTSHDGTPLQISFRSEVTAARGTPVRNAAVAQLEYLQGALTTSVGGNAQFRFADVTEVTERLLGDKVQYSYTSSVSAIFPSTARVPRTMTLALPKDVTALDAFNAKYDGKCGRNEYGQSTFWHDWNPKATGCTLEADVHKTRATVRPHPLGTNDRYPEYDRIWEDGALEMVGVYGAIGGTGDDDQGARDREALLSKVAGALTDARRTEAPAVDGVLKQSVVEGSLRVDGAVKKVKLTAYFVSDPGSAGDAFFASYGAATETADLIVYSGHSGLGVNVAALAKATRTKRAHYQVMFFNGCQSFGYLGPWMHDARIALNGAADPRGTKFLDVIVTALPAYAEATPTEQLLFEAATEKKKPWRELLQDFSEQQMVSHLTTIFGEDDNTFRP